MPMLSRKSNVRGFTAVEIAMVASVIAILALLVLPIFRQRAEDARLAAAQDEVQSLVKALLLVEADMPGGRFMVRLNDLDNRSYQDDPASTSTTPNPAWALEPPRTYWVAGTGAGDLGRFISSADPSYRFDYLSTVVQNWSGPYVAYRSTISLQEILDNFDEFTDGRSNSTQSRAPGTGPIAVFDADIDSQSLLQDRYPVDPWGSPYLLFGSDETVYNIRAIYSLGPDGVPGPVPGLPPGGAADFDRRRGVLGITGSDDIFFEF